MFDLIDWLFFSSCCCCCSGLESDSSPSSSSSSGSADHPRGVRPVYLRCSQGSVAWLYPRGALRVVLRYGTAGKEFQGYNTHTHIQISSSSFSCCCVWAENKGRILSLLPSQMRIIFLFFCLFIINNKKKKKKNVSSHRLALLKTHTHRWLSRFHFSRLSLPKGLSKIVGGFRGSQHLRGTPPDAQTASRRFDVDATATGWQTPLFREPQGSSGNIPRIWSTRRWSGSSTPGNGIIRLRSPTGGRRARRSPQPVTRSLARYWLSFLLLLRKCWNLILIFSLLFCYKTKLRMSTVQRKGIVGVVLQ